MHTTKIPIAHNGQRQLSLNTNIFKHLGSGQQPNNQIEETTPMALLAFLHFQAEALVGTRRLVAVGGAHHSEVRNQTQRWDGLNGLMGRTILTNLSCGKC